MDTRLYRRIDPQEVCQDTFVNVYRYAASFRDEHPRSFKAWVQAISRNVIHRQLSKAARLSLQDLPEGLSEPETRVAGPAANAQIREERELIARAWGLLMLHYAAAWKELSARDRRALELIEVEGRSYAQAGEILSVGMSNMKMIMFRARRRIRAHIARAMDGVGGPGILRFIFFIISGRCSLYLKETFLNSIFPFKLEIA